MAGPEGAFEGVLCLGAGYSSNIKPSKYNLKMAVTTLKALSAVHSGGKMSAEAAMLCVQVRRTCGQQGRFCGSQRLYKPRLNSQHGFGQTT